MMIWYSNPYSRQKNFGRALNEFCDRVPNDAWICIQDGDVMYLTDYWGGQIEDISLNNPEYSLIGCLTNRLRGKHQLHKGEFSDIDMVFYHQVIAERLYRDHYSEVQPTTKGIAGMFMLFPKKVWQQVQFRENSAAFDTFFSRDVYGIGGKIGIAQGLYIFHRYRLGKENPRENNKHLFI
jgi:hypothetical protein